MLSPCLSTTTGRGRRELGQGLPDAARAATAPERVQAGQHPRHHRRPVQVPLPLTGVRIDDVSVAGVITTAVQYM